MAVKVLRCKCEHTFQDSNYGTKQRLHNLSQDGKKATCTVCGNKVNL